MKLYHNIIKRHLILSGNPTGLPPPSLRPSLPFINQEAVQVCGKEKN